MQHQHYQAGGGFPCKCFWEPNTLRNALILGLVKEDSCATVMSVLLEWMGSFLALHVARCQFTI
eukprot:1348976-Amphidinium_carterae.1